jgi:hypothetical protein
MMDAIDHLLDNVQGNLIDGKMEKRTHLSTASNPLLMRLRLAALLVIGHKDYPDALSALTNMQVSIFALFDAIKAKTDLAMAVPLDVDDPNHPESRYYAVKARYAALTDAGPEIYRFYGLAKFTERFKAMSQSILREGRKEYLSGIEEKPIQLKQGVREDFDIPKPSIYEAITGKPKTDQRRRD